MFACPSSTSKLLATSSDELVASYIEQAQQLVGYQDTPHVVVSPYRFNPLGAHIDHQGGTVMARCLDQYTILCFWPRRDGLCRVFCDLDSGQWKSVTFTAGELVDEFGWDSMARASVAAFSASYPMQSGYDAVVYGTLVSGGLSSSASVILAYLTALAYVNDIELNSSDLVELSRQVENDYRGLENGIQDQMSIVFAQQNHMVLLDVEKVAATAVADPQNVDEVDFLMCYSGVSRNLVTGSNFNERVAQCRDAAQRLFPTARHLGEVPLEHRTEARLASLPAVAQRRARHVFGEMQRVRQGGDSWAQADWASFGQLMNASCHSSISHYESGSAWLVDLHDMARQIDGVFGSRFSGGGYGGCLFMLVKKDLARDVATELMNHYLDKYPDLKAHARINIAQSESTVRVLLP